ncbi:hypothetical protein GPJ59_30000, partial [Streptomyces bambusae]|nr:hypothetical protein [Streptomyces bambusae]
PGPSGPDRPLRGGSPDPSASGEARTPGGQDDRDGFTGGPGNDPSTEGTARTPEQNRERERESRYRALDLCKDYRAGRITDDQRDRLAKLARGTQAISRFCQTLMESGEGGGTAGRDSSTGGEDGNRDTDGSGTKKPSGSDILQAPTPLRTPLPEDGDLRR